MKTIFLLWTLVNGQPVDVDAFIDLAQCSSSYAVANENLERARQARKEIADQVAGISLVGCDPVQVTPPAPPEPRKESM